MDLIERIDNAIGRYYTRKGVTDYFEEDDDKGKFYYFCDENAFNDYNIKEEIDEGFEDCGLTGFDENVPDAPNIKSVYKLIKRCYLSCVNEPEQKYEEEEKKYNVSSSTESNSEEDEEDDFMQECLIDPNKDRRQPIHSSPNKDDEIIKCIGSLRIIYDKHVTNPPERSLGTGTVIHIDTNKYCYILTAAHNARGMLRQCKICNKKTLESKCSSNGCNKAKTKKIIPMELIEPTSIQFERRCIKQERKCNDETFRFGQIVKSYHISGCKLRDEYVKYPTEYAGYDLCIMIFKCKDLDEIKMYKLCCSKIELVCDPSLGNSQLNIYGYPGSKFNGLMTDKQFEMWGMGTSQMKGHTMQVMQNYETDKLYICNRDIDTTPGQSGSCIWSELDNEQKFVIYGVHTGGFIGSIKKRTTRANVATFLDDDNLKWIQLQVTGLKVNIIKSVTVYNSIRVKKSLTGLNTRYIISVNLDSQGCMMAYCPKNYTSQLQLVDYYQDYRQQCNDLKRCPANLLFDKVTNNNPMSKPIAVGFEAVKLYQQDNNKDKYMYFTEIQHYLYSNKHFEANSLVVATNGESVMSVSRLICHLLKELTKYTTSYINDVHKSQKLTDAMNVSENDIFLVVSIPSTWNEQDKKMMMCCGEYISRNFECVTDAVGSAFYYGVKMDETIITNNDTLMILNCNEEKTIATTISCLYSTFQFKVVDTDQIPIGRQDVVDRFMDLLTQLLPSEIIDLVKITYPTQWVRQKDQFIESLFTRTLDKHQKGMESWSVELCWKIRSFLATKKKLSRKTKDNAYNNLKSYIEQYKIPNSDIKGAFKLGRIDLKITTKGWLYLYDAALISILQFLKKKFTDVKCNRIVLTGLFATYGFLISGLRKEFPNKHFFELGSSSDLAAVKGALYWICNRDFGSSESEQSEHDGSDVSL